MQEMHLNLELIIDIKIDAIEDVEPLMTEIIELANKM